MKIVDIIKELDFGVEHTVDNLDNVVHKIMVNGKELTIKLYGGGRLISSSVKFGYAFSGCSFMINNELNLNNGKHVEIIKNDIMDIVGQLKASAMGLGYFLDAVEKNPLV